VPEINIETNPPSLGWVFFLSVAYIPFFLFLDWLVGWSMPWWLALLPVATIGLVLSVLTWWVVRHIERTGEGFVRIGMGRFRRQWGQESESD
jgi:hypothetical protein